MHLGRTLQVAKPFLWGVAVGAVGAGAAAAGQRGRAVLIPTSLLRYLTFKLTWDLQQARDRPVAL